MPDRPPTMRSIAAETGFSVMTVSRVLREHPRVKPATRSAVLKVARELGYKPNPLVTALMTQRRINRPQEHATQIALVHCLPHGTHFAENMLTFHAAIRDRAAELGYGIEPFFLNALGMTLKRLMEIIRARGIRGIIWEHFFSANNRFDYDFGDFACVSISNTLIEPAFHQIESDRFAEMRLALEQLGQLGYRRIGYCSMRHVEVIHNYKRLCALLLDQSYSDSGDRIPWLEVEKVEDYEAKIAAWLHRHHPQVVVSQNRNVYDFITRAGFKVPEQVGFLHLGYHPSFTQVAGIDPNWAKRGTIAIDRVVGMLNRNEYGVPSSPLITYVDHHWVPGPSLKNVGPPRAPGTTHLTDEQVLESSF